MKTILRNCLVLLLIGVLLLACQPALADELSHQEKPWKK